MSQIDSQYRVNLTQIFSNYSESLVEFQFYQWLNFLGQNDSIFSFSVYVQSSQKNTLLLLSQKTWEQPYFFPFEIISVGERYNIFFHHSCLCTLSISNCYLKAIKVYLWHNSVLAWSHIMSKLLRIYFIDSSLRSFNLI